MEHPCAASPWGLDVLRFLGLKGPSKYPRGRSQYKASSDSHDGSMVLVYIDGIYTNIKGVY